MMKTQIFRSYGFLLLVAMMLMLEGCTGCSHRSRKTRERHRDRVERRESRRERHRDREHDNDSERGGDWKGGAYSEDFIASIAESEDYDKMLECQFAKLNEIKRLRDEYFQGNLPDKEAQDRMQEISDKYAPIDKALQKADNAGKLTYNQHKRQVKLMGDYLKVAKSVMNRLGSDVESLLGT